MDLDNILYLIKNSNLKNTTKSFLFSIVKDASSQTAEFDNNDLGSTGKTATPENLKELDDLFDSLEPTFSKTDSSADSGVKETDDLLQRASTGKVSAEEINKIHPWEDYYRDVLEEKLMEGIPYTYEDQQMIKRLNELDRLRGQG